MSLFPHLRRFSLIKAKISTNQLGCKAEHSDFENGFSHHYSMLFGPLVMTAAVIDTAVAYAATTVYEMDISKMDIVVLYSLSICVAISISSLYGYYGVYRESRRNLQDDKPNPLSKRKKRFDLNIIYERHLSILLGPLLVIAVTIDSIVVLYVTYLSNAVVVILYSLSIALVSSISLLLGYYRAKRKLAAY